MARYVRSRNAGRRPAASPCPDGLGRLRKEPIMSEEQDAQEPRLHCMIVDLIDDFFAEYPAAGASDKVDTDEVDEVIGAIAKTVAELTSQQDGVIRQELVEQLMRQIM